MEQKNELIDKREKEKVKEKRRTKKDLCEIKQYLQAS